MKKLLILATMISIAAMSGNAFARGSSYSGKSYTPSYSRSSASGSSDHSVRGYTRSNGTYVAPSHATNPDSTRNNNYSTSGNVNPYTGKLGTKPRD